MENVADNLKRINERIAAACARCGRDLATVELVAVSKKKPASLISAAAAAGQRLFGENYVQEFCAKYDELDPSLRWHFIGALQSNKVKYLRGKTELIHTLDRLSLAQEIERQWRKIDAVAEVLVQVNIAAEPTKAGVAPEQLSELVEQVAALPHVRVRGLMTLPPPGDSAEDSRRWFAHLRQLAADITARAVANVEMRHLSMGMSNDFEVAIEEGATLVRVGSAIFGARD